MKCVEFRVISFHWSLPLSMYRANRSSKDGIVVALQAVLSHLKHQRTYAHLLFIVFSYAFKTTLPQYHRLNWKLLAQSLSQTTCLWLMDFLIKLMQRVEPYPPHSVPCNPQLTTDKYVNKFPDDTRVEELISKKDESIGTKSSNWKCGAYNNFLLNPTKTKQFIVDFRQTE